jgi:hypothetical protein
MLKMSKSLQWVMNHLLSSSQTLPSLMTRLTKGRNQLQRIHKEAKSGPTIKTSHLTRILLQSAHSRKLSIPLRNLIMSMIPRSQRKRTNTWQRLPRSMLTNCSATMIRIFLLSLLSLKTSLRAPLQLPRRIPQSPRKQLPSVVLLQRARSRT